MPSELADGVPLLLRKIEQWKPRTVCFVGKGISEAFTKGLRQSRAISANQLRIAIPPLVLQSAAPSASPKRKLSRPRYSKGNSKDDAGYGVMPVCMPHSGHALSAEDVTLFFVCPSTSARVTTHFLDDKARVLSSLRILAHHLHTPIEPTVDAHFDILQ